jgi:hypothetical protein
MLGVTRCSWRCVCDARDRSIGKLHRWAPRSDDGHLLVVGTSFRSGRTGATGDLLMIAAVCCWAIYRSARAR